MNFSKAPTSPQSRSVLACCIALAPVEWRLLRVSAVAMPEGNGSLSMLMSWRFNGTAMQSPSVATDTSQTIICPIPIGFPVQRYSAGIAETSPAEEMAPAALAVLSNEQFSSIVSGFFRSQGRIASNDLNTANAMTQAVMVTPKPQPVFRPT